MPEELEVTSRDRSSNRHNKDGGRAEDAELRSCFFFSSLSSLPSLLSFLFDSEFLQRRNFRKKVVGSVEPRLALLHLGVSATCCNVE
ncbi:hypothetical protein PFLUV_G00161740, partial [Perca fluviatilis]